MCETLAKIFADDTKSYNGITSHEDCCKLQSTLNALQGWSAKWLMGFNTSKCCVMHLGANNKKFDYYSDPNRGACSFIVFPFIFQPARPLFGYARLFIFWKPNQQCSWDHLHANLRGRRKTKDFSE